VKVQVSRFYCPEVQNVTEVERGPQGAKRPTNCYVDFLHAVGCNSPPDGAAVGLAAN